MACGYTHRHYEEMIDLATRSYPCVGYDDAMASDRSCVILRHDVDMDPQCAAELGAIEKRCGARSTFFVLLRSPFYNVLETETLRIFEGLLRDGHDIGLHFDESCYEWDGEAALVDHVRDELRLLRSLLGVDTRAVAFHAPSKRALHMPLPAPEFLYAYDPAFIVRSKYLSDSSRHWREGCACSYLRDRRFPRFQILTHGEWWSRDESPAHERLHAVFASRLDAMQRSLTKLGGIYEGLAFRVVD